MKVKLTGIQVGEGDAAKVLPVEHETYELFSSAMVRWVKRHVYWVLPMSGMMLGGGGAYWYMSPGQTRPGQPIPIVQQGTPGQTVYSTGQVPCQQTVPCQPVVVCQLPACQPVVAPRPRPAESETNRLLKSLIEKLDERQEAPAMAKPSARQDPCACPVVEERTALPVQTRESEPAPAMVANRTASEQRQYDIWVARR